MNIYTRRQVFQGLPIVPMLDILTILLIFFIVHTEFKRQVNVLKLEVPQTHHLAGERGNTDDVLLEVAADGSVALGGQRISAQELPAAVRKLTAEKPQAHLQLSAADGTSMGRFIEVMDLLTAAGLTVEEVPVRIDYKP